MVHRVLSYKNITFAFFRPVGVNRSIFLVRILQLSVQIRTITFFGTVQTIYNLSFFQLYTLGNIDKRHTLLAACLSGTRWTDRVDSVRPFAAHLPGIKAALQDLLNLNLTPQTRSTTRGAISYVSSFKCFLVSAIWIKAITAIDIRN